ncbi:hypothetical protein [Pseudomonas yamanorum]|uniref:Uncharacterized protein n=1 Tax=Pseudomonas yamanorum TaxID=515393 RepID=A0AAJ3H6F9_9PSED|nr:hypothetical protein [Pseudomonas yamanorum]NWD44195.1 hypothetical protein [Pseudomonas yamanorum]
MSGQKSVEPDFAVESEKFQKYASGEGLSLERLVGGFYVDQKTQHAWAEWIRRAATEQRT